MAHGLSPGSRAAPGPQSPLNKKTYLRYARLKCTTNSIFLNRKRAVNYSHQPLVVNVRPATHSEGQTWSRKRTNPPPPPQPLRPLRRGCEAGGLGPTSGRRGHRASPGCRGASPPPLTPVPPRAPAAARTLRSRPRPRSRPPPPTLLLLGLGQQPGRSARAPGRAGPAPPPSPSQRPHSPLPAATWRPRASPLPGATSAPQPRGGDRNRRDGVTAGLEEPG